MSLLLKINGQSFGGWDSARITNGIAQLATTFELSVTDRWDEKLWRVKPFDQCELIDDGVKLATGYIDSTNLSYDDSSHGITVTGRSKTGDLVDCSCSTIEFKNGNFEKIAKELCLPFGINVLSAVDTGELFPSWKSDEGAQVFEALEKLARIRGLLLMDNGNGDLVITRSGKHRIKTVLERGKNIKSCSATFDVVNRFSDYKIKGQQRGGDNISPQVAAHTVASFKDSQVTRYRPLLLSAEDQIDTKSAQARVQWENNIRWGRSQNISCTVQGWQHEEGFWAANTLVRLSDDFVGINADLLITSVTYEISDQGTLTHLELSPPQAFAIEPLTIVKKSPSNPAIQWDMST